MGGPYTPLRRLRERGGEGGMGWEEGRDGGEGGMGGGEGREGRDGGEGGSYMYKGVTCLVLT